MGKQDIKRRLAMWHNVEEHIHAFFKARDFVHVRTPIVVKHPGMEPNLDPLKTRINGEPHGLITSPEYAMKKLVASGLKKIYTITPVFRDNERGRHNTTEFTMLEWYAPGEYEDLLDETEALLRQVLENETPWPRLPFDEAAVDEHGDPHVQEKRFFVTQYPVDQAAMARLSKDGSYAERFEVFADNLELCNGFCELLDSVEQRDRFEREKKERRALGKTVFSIDEELLQALDRIKGPIYGNALGVDRLIMLKYAIRDIHDIQLFS